MIRGLLGRKNSSSWLPTTVIATTTTCVSGPTISKRSPRGSRCCQMLSFCSHRPRSWKCCFRPPLILRTYILQEVGRIFAELDQRPQFSTLFGFIMFQAACLTLSRLFCFSYPKYFLSDIVTSILQLFILKGPNMMHHLCLFFVMPHSSVGGLLVKEAHWDKDSAVL